MSSPFFEPKTYNLYLYKGQDTEFLFSIDLNGTPLTLTGKKFYIELDNNLNWTTDTGHWTEVDATHQNFRLPKEEVNNLDFSKVGGKLFYDASPTKKDLVHLLEVYVDKKC